MPSRSRTCASWPGQEGGGLRYRSLHPRSPAPRRHDRGVRSAGARIMLISDGDVSGVIATSAAGQRRRLSISAAAARLRACWRPRPCAASAGRCRDGCCFATTTSARAPRNGASPILAAIRHARHGQGDVMSPPPGVTDGPMLRACGDRGPAPPPIRWSCARDRHGPHHRGAAHFRTQVWVNAVRRSNEQ